MIGSFCEKTHSHYGYSIEIDRGGKFNPEAAKKLNIPISSWGKLQKGETVEVDGVTFTPDMVVGAPRKGLKALYNRYKTSACNSRGGKRGGPFYMRRDVWRT